MKSGNPATSRERLRDTSFESGRFASPNDEIVVSMSLNEGIDEHWRSITEFEVHTTSDQLHSTYKHVSMESSE